MKIIFILILLSGVVFAETRELVKGSATYEVKHLVKRVTSESHELKGKIQCGDKECEFLVAAPVKSFTSSDSNRDANMLQTTEAAKYPVTSAKGKFPKSELEKADWVLPVTVDFHGVQQNYDAKIHRKSENETKASFNLILTKHKIERPSLFGVDIDDEVPMTFDLKWKVVP